MHMKFSFREGFNQCIQFRSEYILFLRQNWHPIGCSFMLLLTPSRETTFPPRNNSIAKNGYAEFCTSCFSKSKQISSTALFAILPLISGVIIVIIYFLSLIFGKFGLTSKILFRRLSLVNYYVH